MIGTVKNIKCWGCWYKVKITSIDNEHINGRFKLNRKKFRKESIGSYIGAFPFEKIEQIRPSQSKHS